MNSLMLFEAIGEIDEKYITEAKPVSGRKKIIITFIASAAACLILFFFIPNIPNFFGMGAQEGDIYRNGCHIENMTLKKLSACFDGKLLAENIIGDNDFEFYSKTEKFSENPDDWYSLLYSEYNTDYSIVMHCMFGEEKENWKVDMVFTDEATKTVNINGTLVEIAQFDLTLNYPFKHYVLFQYDGVVYDLRVSSNSEDTVYEILELLLK